MPPPPTSNIHLPPLSTTDPPKFRRSKSMLYDNKSPEWYWKLTPILPLLWIRDPNKLLERPAIVAEMERAWLLYQTLNIPGKGDGAGLMAKSKKWRRKLEEEYKKLEPEVRRAKEVALARHEGFAIRGTDGTLDYFTEEVEGGGGGMRGLVGGLLKGRK